MSDVVVTDEETIIVQTQEIPILIEVSSVNSPVRNMVISTVEPSGGQDGDVWFQYIP